MKTPWPKLRADRVVNLVRRFPGKTSTELAKLGRTSPMLMNGALRRLAMQNRLNRMVEEGMNPKVRALRHYHVPILPLSHDLVHAKLIYPRREPFSFGLQTPHVNSPVVPPTDFVELMLAVIPQLDPESLKRILAAAAAARLNPK